MRTEVLDRRDGVTEDDPDRLFKTALRLWLTYYVECEDFDRQRRHILHCHAECSANARALYDRIRGEAVDAQIDQATFDEAKRAATKLSMAVARRLLEQMREDPA